MATYKEAAAKAQKEGTAKKVDIQVHKWEKEGDTLIGRIKAVNEKESDTFDGTYNQYLIETDEGMVATIFGAAVDMLFSTESPVGKVYMFTWQGKRALDKGRTMNVFTVMEIPEVKGGKA